MRQHPFIKQRRVLRTAFCAITLAILAFSANASAIEQSGEAKSMQRVGHVDLQGRPAYQPNFVDYPDGRVIAFIGTHGGSAPNPLKPGSPVEFNGTMIVDITDPNHPVEKFHIPVPVSGGQAQMARLCLGSVLPGGTAGHVYLLRNIQGSSAAGYQMWDVTDVENPVLVKSLTGIRSTHKHWLECNTGIAYMPGSKNAAPLWRQSQAMLIFDWSNPHNNQPPVYIRTFGLPGGQPGAAGAVPNSLHGPISAHEHPNAAGALTRAPTPPGNAIIGNRIYAAWGVGDDGVMTIIDRKKLLPAAYGGTWVPATANSADAPTEAELIGPASPTVGYFLMSPDQGGHTSMPVFGLTPPSYQGFEEFQKRDIVLLASESTADRCQEAPHWSFIVDVTVENSMTFPPATRAALEHDPYHGPMVLSTMSVDPRAGEKYPRGNYCTRGARFGVHSSEENFRNPFYGKLTFLAYFTGGVRVWDIRELQAPVEVGFYVPESNENTDPDGYMTNNVEVDNRGYVLATDRNGSGLDIIQVMPPAIHIVSKK